MQTGAGPGLTAAAGVTPGCRQRVRKGLHIALQTGIMVAAFVGLAAVVYYKKVRPSGSHLPQHLPS